MGRIEKQDIWLEHTEEWRRVRVYVPEAYDLEPERVFPVLYMTDAQNIFSDSVHETLAGLSWRVDEVLAGMEKWGEGGEIVVVAIDHADERRFGEYSPFDNHYSAKWPLFNGQIIEGRGETFTEFFVHTLIPWAHEHYRISATETALAGSSMGGLIALYMATRHPDAFKHVGAFSTALWACQDEMLDYLLKAAWSPEQTYHLHVGTAENAPLGIPGLKQIYVDNALAIQNALLRNGMPPDRVRLFVHVGGAHSEAAWHKQIRGFIEQAFGDAAA